MRNFKRLTIGLGGGAAAVAFVLGSFVSATPAIAAEAEHPAVMVLSEIRSNLVASGDAAELEAFDALSKKQRKELASYFLDSNARIAVSEDATVTNLGSATVYKEGNFEWGEVDVQPTAVSARALSRTAWGTQWFKFAGITLTEVKNSVTYEYSGSNATKLLGYACTVVTNIQPFTSASSSKSSAYISGGKATSNCKVVTKRGILTPLGNLQWSEYSAIHRVTASGTGAVSVNGWY